MSKSIIYATAPGSGQLALQAEYLIRSISEFTTDPYEVVTFFTKKEYKELPDRQVEFFSENSLVRTGNIPLPDHPISSKIKALDEAEQIRGDQTIALLDADTLVLNDPQLSRLTDADLMMKPVDVGWQPWAKEAAREDWEIIYDHVGVDFPGYRYVSTFDESNIPPYWNSGVVVSKVDLAERWLELTEAVLSKYPDVYFADQISLAALSAEFDVKALGEGYNYPLHLRFCCPDDVKILHHHGLGNLRRVFNGKTRKKLAELGIYADPEVPGIDETLRQSTFVLIAQVRRRIQRQVRVSNRLLSSLLTPSE
jgi:hypothetical protein